MIYVLAAALFVFLCGAKFVKSGEFNSDYMSKDTTGAINGIFVLLVFMCHISGYMKLGGSSDTIWLDLKSWLGQLVVVTFLFYSGYGMMCSIMKKGTPYVKGIFRRRFLSLFAHFDIAVLLFLLMNLALGIKTKTRTTLLAFTTWESIGNSNWYITAVLCLYLILIVSFLIFRKHHIPGLIAMTVLHLRTRFCAYKSRKARVVLQHADSLPAGYVVCVSQEIYRQIRDEKQLYLYALHYGRGCCLCCRT